MPTPPRRRRRLKCVRTSPDISWVTTGSSTDTLLVVFDGGPADGYEHVTDPDTDKVIVALTDASWHLYERVLADRILPDGPGGPL